MTYTDRLRERLRAAFGAPCPTCGSPTGGSVRRQAEAIGVTHTALWRFLRGGRPSADLIDRAEAWLALHERAEQTAR